jgi:ornithine cyclodeaminase/alanine dehydrogenase
MTIVSIGSTLPEQREVDAEVVRRCALIVADMPDEVAHDTGDMLAAKQEGIEFESKLVSLNAVLGGKRAARSAESDIVMYKSVGSALQDVVVAEMLLRRAQELGLGTRLTVNIAPVLK